MIKLGKKVTCEHCSYKFETESKLKKVTCPSCQVKFWVNPKDKPKPIVGRR